MNPEQEKIFMINGEKKAHMTIFINLNFENFYLVDCTDRNKSLIIESYPTRAARENKPRKFKFINSQKMVRMI